MTGLRVLHVVPSVAAEASGPSYSVPALAKACVALGNEVTLVTVGDGRPAPTAGFTHIECPQDYRTIPLLRSLRASSEMVGTLEAEAARSDLIHTHSLWLLPNVYPARAGARNGRPLVLSPRGTLSPIALARSRGRKALFWWAAQRAAVRRAALLHATSDQEYEDIRAFGLKQPVAMIPNGVDAPTHASAGPARARRVLYLGRVHPIKGLENLLKAWQGACVAGWELRIVGPAEPRYLETLQRLTRDLGLQGVEFTGPRYGEAKSKEYREASLYVLPSFSENFAVSVAEALAHGTPVITTHGTPWRGLVSEGCGWWTAPSPEGLAGALREALALNALDLLRMGARGRAWVQRDYGWRQIAQEMLCAYQWVLRGGAAPATIRFD